MDKINYIKKYINTTVDIDQTVPFGFVSSVTADGSNQMYLHGSRNIEEKLPFEANSIYRMASQSKFMGTVAFLKLIDQGRVTWDTPLKNYLPE
ncbi:beta-lactamase family protein, partial [Patescibacteria group bacterium]|nr:beta-lactamase family protein [Patescibacteria group bacterium]